MSEPSALDTYGTKMEVEISVHAGDVHGVQLTSIVHLDDYTDKPRSTAKLRAVIELLRSALPVVDLKDAEQHWLAKPQGLASNPDGTVAQAPEDLARIRAAQTVLRKTQEKPA
jgi:hypothetical protein